MQEHTKREEPLSEELLEWVTGARYDSSYFRCPDCHDASAMYHYHTRVGNEIHADAHSAMAQGAPQIADMLFRLSDAHHQAAQAHSVQLAAHHHPDSPWSYDPSAN